MEEKLPCETRSPKAKLVLHCIHGAVSAVSPGCEAGQCRKEYLLNTHFWPGTAICDVLDFYDLNDMFLLVTMYMRMDNDHTPPPGYTKLKGKRKK